MKKCAICGKEYDVSLDDLLRQFTPNENVPNQCFECMELIADISDERMRNGQPILHGFAEARAAVNEYKKTNAMFWFKKANRLDKSAAEIKKSITFAFKKSSKLEYLSLLNEAVINYQQGLSIKPDYVDALNNLGLDLCDLDRPADGLLHLDRGISLAPDDPDLWTNKALCLTKLGRREEAVRCWAKAASLKKR